MKVKNKNIKIIVACHKSDPNIIQDDIYLPIQVGKDLHPEINLGYQCDNEGENISYNNDSFCELTALYWAWKNLKDVDFIGLCHYRRYFAKNNSFVSRIDTNGPLQEQDLISVECINKLQKSEVILPRFWSLPQPIYKAFGNRVMEQDIYILYKVIRNKYPEYSDTFSKYMLGHWKTGYNMFIMRKYDFDNYCSWIFNVLFETRKHVKKSSYISYNRIFGYFGEILTAVYSLQNLKIKQNTIIFIDKKQSKYYLKGIRNTLINILHTTSYRTGLYWLRKSLDDPYWDNYLKQDGIII